MIKNILKNLNLDEIDCEYSDVRIEDLFETIIRITNNDLITCIEQKTVGAFLRVKKNGLWAYSSTTDLSKIQEELVNLATSLNSFPKKYSKLHAQKHGHSEIIKHSDDNFSTATLKEKRELLFNYANLFKNFQQIKSSTAVYKDMYKVKYFKNSVATSFVHDFSNGGFVISFDLAENDKTFSDHKTFYSHHFNGLKGCERAVENYIKTAIPFLQAPTVEAGKYKLVLDQEVTGVFTHESFGHKSEADFMLGDPLATKEWQIGQKVANDCVSIVDSGLHVGTSGYCPIDDEGQPASKTYLIEKGVLAGRLHSIETANELNEAPTGNGRSMGFEYEPIVRMTSTYIEGGQTKKEELLKKAEGGLYVQGVNYGTGLSTFTISPCRAYKISNGKISDPVRVSVISGSVFETLNNIEAVGDDFELLSSAIGGCGKMNQFPLPVSDGGPSILVKDMQVS